VTGIAPAADLLATIVAATRRSVEVRQERQPIATLARKVDVRTGTAGRFRTALMADDRVNVIAECKRRSPSKGVLRAGYDPVAIARGYADAGAAAISVLTEPTFFDGSLAHLAAVRAAVGVPLLRKDFIVSEYQLFEAGAAGADAVLLIVAALDRADLDRLGKRAASIGLDVLVEVHTADELDTALAAGARMVGVNNRNLRTLEVDVHASEALVDRIPRDVVAVSESGLRSAADLIRLRRLGYRAFLIGERFMAAEDPGGELRGLLTDTMNATAEDAKDAEVFLVDSSAPSASSAVRKDRS
jgi:indole-3-glycerol phosphate synthase